MSNFNFWLSANGIFSIHDIKHHHIITFIKSLDPNKKALIHDTLMDLRGFFKFLYDKGIITTNISAFIPKDIYQKQAKYAQEATLSRAFRHLSNNQITIARFRADSASYQKAVVDVVQAHCERFYIRAKRSAEMLRQIGALSGDDWMPIKLEWQKMDVAELADWRPFDGATSYRLIVSRIKRADDQADIFSGQAYTYRAILTNDTETSAKEIVAFYNKRGDSERLFDVMNNDFGWSRLPCSFLSENTAFMILKLYTNKDYSPLLE